MSAQHEELLERAAREMEPNEIWKFEMGSKEKAHSTYVAIMRVMKRKNFYSTTAKKCLNVSREGSVLVICMEEPVFYPAPTKVML